MTHVKQTTNRILSVILVLSLLLSMGVTGAMAAPIQNETTVYVDAADGRDTNAGTEESPVATVDKAYQILSQMSDVDEATIDVSGDAAVAADYETAELSFPVTVSSEDGTGDLQLGGNLYLNGDTEFENITLTNTVSGLRYIVAQCHDLTMGENVTSVPKGSYYLNLVGGVYNGEVTGDSNLVIKSGIWNNVYGGSYNTSTYYDNQNPSDLNGNVSVTVEGGTITTLAGGMFFGKVTGDIDITITGGTFTGMDVDSKGIYGAGIYGWVGGHVNLTVAGSASAPVDIAGSIYGGTRGMDSKDEGSTVSGDVTVSVTGATVGGTITAAGAIDSYSGTSTNIKGAQTVALAAPLTLNGKVTADTFNGTNGTLSLGTEAALTVTGSVTGQPSVTVDTPINEYVYITTPEDAVFQYANEDGSTLTPVVANGVASWTAASDNTSTSLTLKLVVPDVATTFMLFDSYYNQSGTSISLPAPTDDGQGHKVYEVSGITPGVYCYRIDADGYYNLTKPFVVTADDVTAGEKTVNAILPKMAGNGWEVYTTATTNTLRYITDEVNELFTTDGLTMDGTTPYEEINTPAMSEDKATDEFTTQQEMMDWLDKYDTTNDNMYVYSLGTTEYGNEIPLVLFTTADIPEDATLEEAATIVTQTGKPVVQYTAQIHGNEASGGEGALTMIQAMSGDYDSTFDEQAVLDSMELYIIPRQNPDGSEEWIRQNPTSNEDMNRDHLLAQNPEIQMIHHAYALFEPEVAIDGHEFSGGFRSDGDVATDENGQVYLTNLDDVRISSSGSLNSDPTINEKVEEMLYQALDDCTNTGLRSFDYGATVANVNGRAYYGLLNCYSFLIETRGIYLSKTVNFERRVFAQYTAAKSMLEYVEEHGDEIVANVARARAEDAEKGATYDPNNLLVLESGKSNSVGHTMTRPSFYFDGTYQNENQQDTFYYYDTALRTRVSPTAYVLPVGEEWAEIVKTSLESIGADVYTLEPGSTVDVQQYEQAVLGSDEEATLTDVSPVTFPQGAYVVTMDQDCSMVIAMTLEPDVTDTTDGCSLTDLGLLTADESGMYPLYRYIGDNPRVSLGLESQQDDTDSDSHSGSGIGSITITVLNPFADVDKQDYYYDAVVWANRKGITSGMTDTTFAPDLSCTRAQAVMFLWRAMGSPAPKSTSNPFQDVSSSDYYYSAVLWAVEQGITSGTTADTFSPNGVVTRGQMMTFLYKAMGAPAAAGSQSFADVASDAYYASSVQWAVSQGITAGTSADTFSPNADCTRAQIVTFLYKAVA